MEVFRYDDVGALTKYAREIYSGLLILIGIIALIVLIVNIFHKHRGVFAKILVFIITPAAAVGLYFLSGMLFNQMTGTYESVEKYNAAYENGDIITISGTVENFASYSDRKTFTLAGVDFTIFSTKTYKSPEGDTDTPIHYRYTEGKTSVTTNSTTNTTDRFYSPEKCLISANQKLEIQYIVEFGESRILSIKELTE